MNIRWPTSTSTQPSFLDTSRF